ncbi:hypothetical protein AB0A73_13230 [Glycomyces sp. NPDC047369]|uniref:Uncharacterized protein n=1 Tax=Micromonospora parva TaxID=1464048 RepID=A0ABW6VVY9_9ACTN
MKYVLLILAGGTGVPTAVFLIARQLVERHDKQYGQAYAAQGELQVANDEARRRAAQRTREMAR